MNDKRLIVELDDLRDLKNLCFNSGVDLNEYLLYGLLEQIKQLNTNLLGLQNQIDDLHGNF